MSLVCIYVRILLTGCHVFGKAEKCRYKGGLIGLFWSWWERGGLEYDVGTPMTCVLTFTIDELDGL